MVLWRLGLALAAGIVQLEAGELDEAVAEACYDITGDIQSLGATPEPDPAELSQRLFVTQRADCCVRARVDRARQLCNEASSYAISTTSRDVS